MKARNITYCGIAVILLMTVCKGKDKNEDTPIKPIDTKVTPVIQLEISGGYKKYVYAPSAIEDNGVRYMFVCKNRDQGVVVDYVYLYTGTRNTSGNYIWDQGKEVLGPSASGWDRQHTCDPDVREFKLRYKGETYNWIMTYLGCDQTDNNHNQIGLAFSKNIDGPYIKYDKNPLIPTHAGFTAWGVGQSTSIVIDTSSIQLYFSSSPFDVMVRTVKLNDLDHVDIGTPQVVKNITPNAYIACSKKNIYGVYEKRVDINDGKPTGDYSYFIYKPLTAGLFSAANDWIVIGQVGPGDTKFPHNHNPGFLTDKKGYMLSDDEAIVYFTVGESGDNWLWSYQLYSATFDLKKLNK
jgi:hypothetical protein